MAYVSIRKVPNRKIYNITITYSDGVVFFHQTLDEGTPEGIKKFLKNRPEALETFYRLANKGNKIKLSDVKVKKIEVKEVK